MTTADAPTDEPVHPLLRGFRGFVTAAILEKHSCQIVPRVPGVYGVTIRGKKRPRFRRRNRSQAGNYKSSPVTRAELDDKWVAGVQLLYVGQSGSLRERIQAYIQCGLGKSGGHRGGSFIWELEEPERLRFCWRPTRAEPRDVERRMIQKFKKLHGKRPFANRTG
jgi:hypothetical protein